MDLPAGAKWINTKGKTEHVKEVREGGRNTLSSSYPPGVPSTVHNTDPALSEHGADIPSHATTSAHTCSPFPTQPPLPPTSLFHLL